MNNIWILDDEHKTKIALLTLGELYRLQFYAPDAILTSINGKQCHAIDCDEDTRYGYIAYGHVL